MRPDPSPPAGSTTFEVTARDGTQLLAREWRPTGDAKSAVVVMHGLKDHSARYASLAARWVASGHAVYAFDLRGHGRSAGSRVAPDDWNDYVDDLGQFVTLVQQKVPGKPVFVFGHSMGGAIATRVAQTHQPPIAGLILSGPALALDAPPLLIALTRMAGFATPRAPALDLPNKSFSTTPGSTEAMTKDELVSQPPGPARTAAGLVEGIRHIWSDIDRLTMPLLVLHGTADKLTAPSGSRALIDRAPASDKTLRIYERFFHDLLHEPEAARVESDIVAWTDAHTGGAAVATVPVHTGELAGDPRGWTQAVELALGVSRDTEAGTNHFGGTFALALARPRPLGWHGAVTARRVVGGYGVALRPLGIAVRAGATMIGVSGGVSLLTDTEIAASGGAVVEQPLGPLHVGLRAELDRPFASGTELVTWLVGTLRVGGDRAYWPHARAGIGPAVSGGYQCAGDSCGWALLAGLQLYGVD